jgi:type II secretory pathway component PulC
MNWIAMPVALILLAMVAYHIYQRHFMQQQIGQTYQFDDLPTMDKVSVTANIQQIIDAHVFGRIPEASELESVAVKTEPAIVVPMTPLNIKLTGVIDSDSPENGIAMLEVDRGRTLVVSVGEKIGKTDAILHQVLPGEVLLDRNGTIESVKMIRKTLSLAKLDTTLIDSLPQPYREQAGAQSANEGSTSGTPISNLDGNNRTSNTGMSAPSNSLPIPRRLLKQTN